MPRDQRDPLFMALGPINFVETYLFKCNILIFQENVRLRLTH